MLSAAETVRIYKNQPEMTFSAGQVIFEQGQKGDCMYGILMGEVELHVNGKVVETIQAGDVFGEGALVHPDRNRASTAIAKTDCILASMNKERFLFAVQETPMFALKVMQSFSARLRRLKQLG